MRFRRKKGKKETVFYLDSPYVPYGFNGKGGKGGWNKGHAEEDPRLLFRKIEVTRVKVALKRGKGTGISTGWREEDRTVLRSISLDRFFCVALYAFIVRFFSSRNNVAGVTHAYDLPLRFFRKGGGGTLHAPLWRFSTASFLSFS